jgi:hypothetical protein
MKNFEEFVRCHALGFTTYVRQILHLCIYEGRYENNASYFFLLNVAPDRFFSLAHRIGAVQTGGC